MSIGEKIVEKLIEGEVSINKLLDSDVWPCIVAREDFDDPQNELEEEHPIVSNSISQSKAVHELLDYISDQIDAILKNSTTRPNSRCGTPSTSTTGQTTSACDTLGSKIKPIHDHQPANSRACSNTIDNDHQTTPRRVQLFSSNDSIKNRSKSRHGSDFRPLNSSPTSPNAITLADFVTSDSKKKRLPKRSPNILSNDPQNTKKVPTRRITPTTIPVASSELKPQAMFMVTSVIERQSTTDDFSSERQQLKAKKAEISASSAEFNFPNLAKTPSKPRPSSELFVIPDPKMVSSPERLSRLAHIYSALIAAGWTYDVTADLNQLVQVLCCRIRQEVDSEMCAKTATVPLLHSIHNATFFALETLAHCELLLKLMDRHVRRLLCDHSSVALFNPDLVRRLSDSSTDVSLPTYIPTPSTFSSVSYQADTDNSRNFPSDKNFILFKKQRDLFYEVKRDWDNHHTEPGWGLDSHKVLGLFSMNGVSVSNHVHLARLFVSQLLVSCLRGDGCGGAAEDDSTGILGDLMRTQPQRYRKLAERFVLPMMTSGRVDNSSHFNGQEVFFKQFIEVARDAVFVQHLKDCFTRKLLELSSLEIETNSDADSDTNGISDVFVDCVLTTRLLAKFLGYVNFLPYMGAERLTPTVGELYLELRQANNVPLDVSAIFQHAQRDSRTCLVIPWIAQYMSQADESSLSVPYYLKFSKELGLYYQHVQQRVKDCSYNHLLQYVCLSWLFSLSQFEAVLPTPIQPAVSQALVSECSLDCLPVIPVSLVYICSASLQGIRRALVEYTAGMRSRQTTVRKITPLTAQVADTSVQENADKSRLSLQQALEESFYNNQPPSLRKTVSFVSERVASSYIKEFRLSHLNPALIEGRKFVHRQAAAVGDMSRVEAVAKPQVDMYCRQTYNSLHALCLSDVSQYFTSRASVALTSLLTADVGDHVIAVCCCTALRQGRERVKKWLEANLTHQYLSTELRQELFKYVRNSGHISVSMSGPPALFVTQQTSHSWTAPSPSDTLLQLQDIAGRVAAGNSPDTDTLTDIVCRVTQCLDKRHDVTHLTADSLLTLLVSMLVSVSLTNPSSLHSSMKPLSSLWNNHLLVDNREHLLPLIPSVNHCQHHDDDDSYQSVQEKFLDFYLYQRNLMSFSET